LESIVAVSAGFRTCNALRGSNFRRRSKAHRVA
jgi:hypothetical protein